MENCYYCDKELAAGEGKAFSQLGMGVAEGKVCSECENESGYVNCYVCSMLAEDGSNETGHCDICGQYFHTGCDRGWHSSYDDFNCSACGRSRGLDVY
jgi:hypothetical protein